MENSIGRSSEPYMTLTTKCFPITKNLASESYLPLACTVQPFLENEEPLPEASVGQEEIIRCISCKCYINPWVDFLNGGQQ